MRKLTIVLTLQLTKYNEVEQVNCRSLILGAYPWRKMWDEKQNVGSEGKIIAQNLNCMFVYILTVVI